MSVWIDVSTVMHWDRIVGIVRCEIELAKRYLNDPKVRFVEFLGKESHPVEISTQELREKIERITLGSNLAAPTQSSIDEPFQNRVSFKDNALHFAKNKSPAMRFILMLLMLPVGEAVAILFSIGQILFNGIANLRAKARNEFDLFRKVGRVQHVAALEASQNNFAGHQDNCGWEKFFEKGDLVISIGLTWDHLNMDTLGREKKKHGFLFAGICYDLIPVDLPQYVPDGYGPFIENYLIRLMETADHIFCISKTTENDLHNFAERQGVSQPSTSVAYLGSESKTRPSFAKLPKRLKEEPFITFVSTFEPRKNHETLYRAYVELSNIGELDKIPTLVFVGMRGWNTDDLQKQMQNDIRIRDSKNRPKILRLEHVTDGELNWLYANSSFTVYPSAYEGWGLPIVESLSRGVPVITSDTPACVEASAGRATKVRTFDSYAWANQILEFAQNRKALERAIQRAKGYQATTWDDFASAIMETCTAILQNEGVSQ